MNLNMRGSLTTLYMNVPGSFVRKVATGNICFHRSVVKHSTMTVIYQQRRGYSRLQATPQHYKDKVPKNYEMIHEGILGKRQSYMFGILGSVVIGYLALFCYIALRFSTNPEQVVVPVIDREVPSLVLIFSIMMIVFALVWTVVGYNFIKLPVQRIYESPGKDQYIGFLKKGVFGTERVDFALSDIDVPPHRRGRILKRGNVIIKGRNCLVYACDFKSPSYFNAIVGYGLRPPGQKPKPDYVHKQK